VPNDPPVKSQVEQSAGFLDVFVVRSFRESHLENVLRGIKEFVNDYQSDRWNSKPYRLVDTERDITSASVIMNEITARIARSAITIVILDGLRYNVLFELGYLYAARKPIILLKHKRWGPSFNELDLAASDLKGVVVKDFDHEDKDGFMELLKGEFDRCEKEFFEALGTHVLVPQSDNNYVTHEWTYNGESSKPVPDVDKQPIVLKSEDSVDLAVSKRITEGSAFYMEFELPSPNAGITVYLKMRFCKDGTEKTAWFGYCSKTVRVHTSRPDETSEVTIPLAASGGGTYVIMDDLYAMLRQRLGTIDLGPVIVETLRLRGRAGTVAHVKKILISG